MAFGDALRDVHESARGGAAHQVTRFQFLAVFGDGAGLVGGAPFELECSDRVVGDDGGGNTIGSELRGDGGARCGIEGLQG